MVLDIVQILKEIRDLYHNVTLSVDVFFINSIPFLINLSKISDSPQSLILQIANLR